MSALLALSASVLWGMSDFAGGFLTRRLSPWLVLAWGQVPGLLIVAVWALPRLGNLQWGTWLIWATIAGAMGMLGLGLFYSALSIGRVGVVAPIVAASVIVPVAVSLLLGERPSALQNAGIAAAIIGVILAAGPELGTRALKDGSGAHEDVPDAEATSESGTATLAARRSVLLALVAAVCLGMAMMSIQRASAYDPVLTVLVMRILALVGFGAAGLVILRRMGSAPLLGERGDVWRMMAVGLGDVAALLCFVWANSSGENLAQVAVLGSLFPVVAVMLGRWLLAETLRPVQWVGAAATIAGTVAIAAG